MRNRSRTPASATSTSVRGKKVTFPVAKGDAGRGAGELGLGATPLDVDVLGSRRRPTSWKSRFTVRDLGGWTRAWW